LEVNSLKVGDNGEIYDNGTYADFKHQAAGSYAMRAYDNGTVLLGDANNVYLGVHSQYRMICSETTTTLNTPGNTHIKYDGAERLYIDSEGTHFEGWGTSDHIKIVDGEIYIGETAIKSTLIALNSRITALENS